MQSGRTIPVRPEVSLSYGVSFPLALPSCYETTEETHLASESVAYDSRNDILLLVKGKSRI